MNAVLKPPPAIRIFRADACAAGGTAAADRGANSELATAPNERVRKSRRCMRRRISDLARALHIVAHAHPYATPPGACRRDNRRFREPPVCSGYDPSPASTWMDGIRQCRPRPDPGQQRYLDREPRV